MTASPDVALTRATIAVLTAFAAGAAVSVGIGVYGSVHEGTGVAVNLPVFSSYLTLKVWLTTVAFGFAIVQVVSALVLYGRLPGSGRVSGVLHRWSGRIAVAFTVPVAAHCLYALGLGSGSPRILVHSLLGTFFYGVFTTKMLVLTRDDSPGWVLPVVGGGLFTMLVALWLTSSLWFFTKFGVFI